MKTIAEYIERAAAFEQMAAKEKDSAFKALLLKQAAAYRKLAEDRAKQLDVPLPIRKNHSGGQ